MRFDTPTHYLARLAGRQHTLEHVPSVLCQHTSVVKVEFGILACYLDHPFGSIGCQDDFVSSFKWSGIDKAVGAAVIVCLESFELTGLFAVRACNCLAGSITWETVQATIHKVGLVPVLRRQELDVQSRFACQSLGHRLVEPNRNFYGSLFPFGGRKGRHNDAAVEVVVVIAQTHFDLTCIAVHGATCGLGHKVPLLGSLVQTHGTTLHGTHAVVNNFDAGVLLIVEASVEVVAIDQNIDTLAFEILKVVESEVLLCLLLLIAAASCEQEERGE